MNNIIDKISITISATIIAVGLPFIGIAHSLEKHEYLECVKKSQKEICERPVFKPNIKTRTKKLPKIVSATLDQPQTVTNENGLRINREIWVYSSAVRAGESWCQTSGGLDHIEVDTVNNLVKGSWRYICKGNNNE